MSSIDKTILLKNEFADDTIQPDASSSSSVITDHMKNPHRIKLAPDEIKLIMFLVVKIKPFKYVGDKSLSQTKKWELIQTKYYEAKRKDNELDFIVPTVRTLQRQLSAGIKKAETRQKKKKLTENSNSLAEIEDAVEKKLFDLKVESATNHELEDMAYQLNELSDYIKRTKGSQPPRSSSIQRIMNPQSESPPHHSSTKLDAISPALPPLVHPQRSQLQAQTQAQTQTQPQPQPQPQPQAQPQPQPQPQAHSTPQQPKLIQEHDPQPIQIPSLQSHLLVHLLLQLVQELQTELETIVERLQSIKKRLDNLK